jgi:hypothetical protein
VDPKTWTRAVGVAIAIPLQSTTEPLIETLPLLISHRTVFMIFD